MRLTGKPILSIICDVERPLMPYKRQQAIWRKSTDIRDGIGDDTSLYDVPFVLQASMVR